MVADVAQVRRTQQGVANGMNEHVGIAVAKKAEGVRNANTAQPKVATFDKAVYVKA